MIRSACHILVALTETRWPAVPGWQRKVGRDEGATAATYALVLALMVTAALLLVPGLGARLFAAIAYVTGGRIAHWLY